MQQMIFIAHFIACSTCFGQYYAHHQYYPRHSYTAPTTPDIPYSSIYNARHLMPKTQILPNLQITFSVFAAPNTTGSDHLYNTLELLMMGMVLPETCWACNKICNKYHLLHLVVILFPHNFKILFVYHFSFKFTKVLKSNLTMSVFEFIFVFSL